MFEYLNIFPRCVGHRMVKILPVFLPVFPNTIIKNGPFPPTLCLFVLKNRNKSALTWHLFPVFCSVFFFFSPLSINQWPGTFSEEGNFTETRKPSVGVADENTAHCCGAIPCLSSYSTPLLPPGLSLSLSPLPAHLGW